jgi:hypothetical protein
LCRGRVGVPAIYSFNFSAVVFYFLFESSAPPWTWIGVVRHRRRPLPLRAARTLLPPSSPSPPLTMDRSLTGAHRNSRSRHRRGDGAPPAVGAGVPRGPGHPGRGDEYSVSLSAPYFYAPALLLPTPLSKLPIPSPLPLRMRMELTAMHSQRNTCSTCNLLAEEGRRVAAALAPEIPAQWEKSPI